MKKFLIVVEIILVLGLFFMWSVYNGWIVNPLNQTKDIVNNVSKNNKKGEWVYYIITRENEENRDLEKTIYRYSTNNKITEIVAGPYMTDDQFDHEFDSTISVSKDGSKAIIADGKLYLILNNKIELLYFDKDFRNPVFSPKEDKIALSIDNKFSVFNLNDKKIDTINIDKKYSRYYPVYWFQKNNEEHIVLEDDDFYSLNFLDYNLNKNTFTEVNKRLSTGENFEIKKNEDIHHLGSSKKYPKEIINVGRDQLLYYADYQIDKNGNVVVLTKLPECNNKKNIGMMFGASPWVFGSRLEDLICLEYASEWNNYLKKVFENDPKEENFYELDKSAQKIIDEIISTGKVSFGNHTYYKTDLTFKKFNFLKEQNPTIKLFSKDVAVMKKDLNKIDNNKNHAFVYLAILLNSLKFSAKEEFYEIIGQIDDERYFVFKEDYCDVFTNKLEIGIMGNKDSYEKIEEYLPIKNKETESCHGDMYVKYIGSFNE